MASDNNGEPQILPGVVDRSYNVAGGESLANDSTIASEKTAMETTKSGCKQMLQTPLLWIYEPWRALG